MACQKLVKATGLSTDKQNVVIDIIGMRAVGGGHLVVSEHFDDFPKEVSDRIRQEKFPVYLLCQLDDCAPCIELLDLRDFELAPSPVPEEEL